MNAMRPLVCVLLLMTSGCMARRELAPIDELTLSVDAMAVTAAALDEPLTAARALQIALAQNPEVRAALARLDAVEAERVQAGLLRNPMLSLMAMRPDGGGRLAVTASWMQSLFDLLTRSRRVGLADADARRADARRVGAAGTAGDSRRARPRRRYYQCRQSDPNPAVPLLGADLQRASHSL